MKRNLIAVAVLAASAFGVSAYAADGVVNFNGSIVDAACEVVNTPSNPLNVQLGNVSKTAFASTGDRSSATKFTLQLKNCPVTVSSATVKFDGAANGGDNNVLALTQETGVATGVGIQLSDNDGTPLPLFTNSKSYTLDSGATTNNLDFIARYISTNNSVTAGPANSTASFTVNYN